MDRGLFAQAESLGAKPLMKLEADLGISVKGQPSDLGYLELYPVVYQDY